MRFEIKHPKNMKKIFLSLLIVISSLSANIAQKLTHVQGELLIKPVAGIPIQKWVKEWQTLEGIPTNLKVKELVSEPMNVWLCTFDFTTVNESKLLNAIRLDTTIEIAQLNHLVEPRSTVPNDPQFDMQWHYLNVGQSGGGVGEDLDADLAWDITTGGVTPSGDTIVVCVIDDGLSLTHPDFGNNVWVNRKEIPNNRIDDDNNGYVDDYRGWNILRNSDDITQRTTHGTPVAGIIGAKGNNGAGVTGVNWNVKLMIVAGIPETEAQALTAYSYPLAMRRRYNNSNGTQGAFVVATNSSWGAPNLFARDAPLWCAMYDSLGTQGILNAGATSNSNVNVDIKGDLPTTCPSDYLIAVTSLDNQGNLSQEGGYGVMSVDLGSYGENIWTTQSPADYGTVTGTSYSTPQVAGAIALLYSAPCASFAALYKSDPKAAALFARQFILQGVTPKASLTNFVATGGRLNLNNSLRQLTAACAECFPPTSVSATEITDKIAKLGWLKNAEITRVDLRWRAVGAATWTEITNVSSPYNLTNLQACTNYEFQLKPYCGGEALEYSKSVLFKTDGCCVAPSTPQISFIGSAVASVRWTKVLAASSYTLRFRVKGTQNWQTSTTTNLSFNLNNLIACTEYELQLASLCNGTLSDFGNITTFRTPNCGACRDLQYCIPNNLDAAQEWIASVKFGGLLNTTGSNEGYGDYTGMTPTKLTIGSTYELDLKPGYIGIPYSEYFIVWIDYNQDGIFVDSEAIFQQGNSTSNFKANITISATAKLGITRLRVAMQFLTPGGPCSFTSTQGGAEVEDYCVEILKTTGVNDLSDNVIQMQVSPNPFKEQLLVELNLTEVQQESSLEIVNALGQVMQQKSLGSILQGLQTITFDTKNMPSGLYFIRYINEAGQIVVKKGMKQ